jgi:hypothetical protein
VWSKISQSNESTNELIPVVGLLVKDPRLVLPKKKFFNKTYLHTQKSIQTELDSGINEFI